MLIIPTGDFVGVLSDVIPFAGDDDIPELNCVRLEWDGDQLHALATDRYRIAWARWVPGDVQPGEEVQDDLFTDWGSADDPWAMSIALNEARELVKVFKLPAKEYAVPIKVDYRPEKWSAKVVRDRETGHSAITVDVPDTQAEFPDVRVLLARAETPVCTSTAVYSAALLADFAKVRPTGPMELTFTDTLTRVKIGERFLGAVMPMRAGEERS